MKACFLTGPVAVKPEVHAAFRVSPISHRDGAFLESMHRVRTSLKALVNAPHVALMLGSGTLANDVVAAQLSGMDASGLILSNGEFGERLVDHARRWGLHFETLREPWGRPFGWQQATRLADELQPRWIWAVLSETSTGVLNPLPALRELSKRANADLCLDAVSAIGLMPVNLVGVRFATAVSGKGLAAFPGLAAVFHDGRLENSREIPRYLDLAEYERLASVPFTHSSNLVNALRCSLLATDWAAKFARVERFSRGLRAELRRHGIAPLAAEQDATPGITTIHVPDASQVAARLAEDGLELACHSAYLHERNWLQIALMGEIDETALLRLPGALAKFGLPSEAAPPRARPASPLAAARSSDTPLCRHAR